MVLALPMVVVSLGDNSLITVVFEVVFGDPSPWFLRRIFRLQFEISKRRLCEDFSIVCITMPEKGHHIP